jgi:hypothetical protein
MTHVCDHEHDHHEPEARQTITTVITGVDVRATSRANAVTIAVSDAGWWRTDDDAWDELIRTRTSELDEPDGDQVLAIIKAIAERRQDIFEIKAVS